ncbi:BZ3500_MvSof-1268-A1-R1_Chr8-2g10204 [Microbotryum saponariae]|uniref:BZ3500_MvSof-1268-A1-R1_Chr8-2g10204 protein n=1 Tax=Microbotryum saponariae TaxID=289078 RepID=A0A2X0MW43_9BASI|nr:BZ3500_MvSof-1268-A1-R1_Chr8-2g10204 [Microbotryum saponariae]SDA02002.1 BZ3501_MvSof-1269-A2-R1_Chr8-2g09954 [Microbotryum saponariae]
MVVDQDCTPARPAPPTTPPPTTTTTAAAAAAAAAAATTSTAPSTKPELPIKAFVSSRYKEQLARSSSRPSPSAPSTSTSSSSRFAPSPAGTPASRFVDRDSDRERERDRDRFDDFRRSRPPPSIMDDHPRDRWGAHRGLPPPAPSRTRSPSPDRLRMRSRSRSPPPSLRRAPPSSSRGAAYHDDDLRDRFDRGGPPPSMGADYRNRRPRSRSPPPLGESSGQLQVSFTGCSSQIGTAPQATAEGLVPPTMEEGHPHLRHEAHLVPPSTAEDLHLVPTHLHHQGEVGRRVVVRHLLRTLVGKDPLLVDTNHPRLPLPRRPHFVGGVRLRLLYLTAEVAEVELDRLPLPSLGVTHQRRSHDAVRDRHREVRACTVETHYHHVPQQQRGPEGDHVIRLRHLSEDPNQDRDRRAVVLHRHHLVQEDRAHRNDRTPAPPTGPRALAGGAIPTGPRAKVALSFNISSTSNATPTTPAGPPTGPRALSGSVRSTFHSTPQLTPAAAAAAAAGGATSGAKATATATPTGPRPATIPTGPRGWRSAPAPPAPAPSSSSSSALGSSSSAVAAGTDPSTPAPPSGSSSDLAKPAPPPPAFDPSISRYIVHPSSNLVAKLKTLASVPGSLEIEAEILKLRSARNDLGSVESTEERYRRERWIMEDCQVEMRCAKERTRWSGGEAMGLGLGLGWGGGGGGMGGAGSGIY